MAYQAALKSKVRFSEIYLNDLDTQKANALGARIKAAGGVAVVHNGPADIVIDNVVDAINPAGLHFAFLDPYNLEYLSVAVALSAHGHASARQRAGSSAQSRPL